MRYRLLCSKTVNVTPSAERWRAKLKENAPCLLAYQA